VTGAEDDECCDELSAEPVSSTVIPVHIIHHHTARGAAPV